MNAVNPRRGFPRRDQSDAEPASHLAAVTGVGTVDTASVLMATLGLSAACWAIAAWLMDGMDMGVATRPGSFWFFAAAWVTMMAAMMLPGAARPW